MPRVVNSGQLRRACKWTMAAQPFAGYFITHCEQAEMLNVLGPLQDRSRARACTQAHWHHHIRQLAHRAVGMS